MKPVQVKIRCYQVGFGDCFLLSVFYDNDEKRHVLIDLGSMGLPEGIPKNQLTLIAKDIQEFTGGKLHAVVATHRHRDHISGFATNARGTASGDLITKLKPDLVVQPWTEDPDLEETATAPAATQPGVQLSAAVREVRTLASMQRVAAQIWEAAKRSRSLQPELKAMLSFLGEDNVKNLSAVKNLMTMAENDYVHAEKPTKLQDILPATEVTVLGPPTVEQHAAVKSQRDDDPDEFWLRLAMASETARPAGPHSVAPLFPDFAVDRQNYNFPVNTRWFVQRSKKLRGEQMLRIVTMLDKAMNNTSVILHLRIGTKSFLFPGDAQIENWEYALAQEHFRKLLKSVDVYKVGHHGSRNATPKSLWKLFEHRSDDEHDAHRLTSLMSTMAHMHGSEDNKSEVPRKTLVSDLEKHSAHFSTQNLLPNQLFHELAFDVTE